MSADDQAFLDILSAVPNDVTKYANEIADALDKHLDGLSSTLRDHIPVSWIRSSKASSPQTSTSSKSLLPPTTYDKLKVFVRDNRKTLIGVTAFLGLTTYLIYRRRRAYGRKRRAKRAASGARVEVVVIAGSPTEPITRSLSLDLERRGFIVYVVCNSIEEEMLVKREGRTDIKPLTLDMTDPASANASLERFSLFFSTAQHAFPGAKPHHLILSSLIIIPSSTYPSALISSTSLSPPVWSDLLNTRVLYPITLVHTFLPLLDGGHHQEPHRSSIIILTNSIISSLKAPLHAPESTVITALETFTSTLNQELSASPISVTNIKLGHFDISSLVPHYHQQLASHSPRGTPGASTKTAPGKGSPMRELHNAVFDTIESSSKTSRWSLWRQPSTIRVGQGSVTYGFAGKVVPRGLVGWMMGLRSGARTGEDEDEYVRVYG